MHRSATTLALGTASVLIATLGLAAPAHAKSATFTLHDGTLIIWKDASDTLCLKAAGSRTNIQLNPVKGGKRLPTHGVTDAPGGGAHCSGNLSIPEDQPYRVLVVDVDGPTPTAFNGPLIYS